MTEMQNNRKIVRIIWWVYVALLFVFVVVKFRGSFTELTTRINDASMEGAMNYNFIPLRSIGLQVARITQWWALRNLLGNIIPFIPFGFLLPLAYRNLKTFLNTFIIGIYSIVSIELFQYFTKLGSFDVDDIILNMTGICCGYLIIWGIKHLAEVLAQKY